MTNPHAELIERLKNDNERHLVICADSDCDWCKNRRDAIAALEQLPSFEGPETAPAGVGATDLPTCSKCGERLIFNVPRLGPDGGYVHAKTYSLFCGNPQQVYETAKPTLSPLAIQRLVKHLQLVNKEIETLLSYSGRYADDINQSLEALQKEL